MPYYVPASDGIPAGSQTQGDRAVQTTPTDYSEFLAKPELWHHPDCYLFLTTDSAVVCLDCAKTAVCKLCHDIENCQYCTDDEICNTCDKLPEGHKCDTRTVPVYRYGLLSSLHVNDSDECGGVSCDICKNPILNVNGCYGDGINPYSKDRSNPEPCDNCASDAEDTSNV